MDFNPLFMIQFDLENNTSRYFGLKSGQAAMDCITDVYTNHGYLSVWAWVQTAFLPVTAVAVAGACIGNNLN
ncbi:hypothetical protein [Prolixibacter sp. SD074]|uniref:hypothetical protein n=1 Tax=Prolixibacter sp. SD074 TaxID=2652391 RepID=UPI00129933FF|nr:hypothetical protein [Prolixibacter sp. SD074]